MDTNEKDALQTAIEFFFPNNNWVGYEAFFSEYFPKYFSFPGDELYSSVERGLYENNNSELQRAIDMLGRDYYFSYGYYEGYRRKKHDLCLGSAGPSSLAKTAIELIQAVIEERIANKIQKSDKLETKLEKLCRLLQRSKAASYNASEPDSQSKLYYDIEEALMEINLNDNN